MLEHGGKKLYVEPRKLLSAENVGDLTGAAPLAENWRPASILIVICIPASRHIAFEQLKGTLNHVYKYEVQIQSTNEYKYVRQA